MQLCKNVKATVVQAAVAAGSTDVATTEVDSQGYEGVLFLASLTPASTATTSKVKVQVAATTTSTFVDVDGSSDTTLNSGGLTGTWCIGVDCYKPTKRYVRAYVTRGTSNTTVESVVALRYGPKKAVVTWSTSNTAVTATVGASSS